MYLSEEWEEVFKKEEKKKKEINNTRYVTRNKIPKLKNWRIKIIIIRNCYEN